MPSYLRQFYIKKLLKVKKEEQKQSEAASQKSKTTVSRPSIQPKFKR